MCPSKRVFLRVILTLKDPFWRLKSRKIMKIMKIMTFHHFNDNLVVNVNITTSNVLTYNAFIMNCHSSSSLSLAISLTPVRDVIMTITRSWKRPFWGHLIITPSLASDPYFLGWQIFLIFRTYDLSAPSIHHFLPHTVGHPNSFVPSFKISKNRNPVSLVLGIPTVKREQQVKDHS